MLKIKFLNIVNYFKLVSVAFLFFPASAKADVFLRDWLTNPLNECLNTKVQSLVQADDNTKVTFLEYSVKDRPQPFEVVDARFLIRKVLQNQAQLLNLELAAAATFNWAPFPENNFYLGFRTEQVNPTVVVRKINSSAENMTLDISDCLSL